jgi:hypothetical protein
MIDSGATALFINKHFVQCHHIICSLLPNTIALHNIDGSKNKAGLLTHFARLTLTIGSWNEPTDFLVTDLGLKDIILGLLWLKKVNPTIDWDSGEMEILNSPEQFTPSLPHILEANCSECRAWIKAGIITDASNEIWVCAGYTLSTKLAIKAGEGKAKRTFEELVPKEYRCHAKVFMETESHQLPKHQPWDHTIDLKPNAPETLKTKVYPMPINKQKTLDQFIQENLEKGYIVPSKSPMASPVFFVKKKTSDLRLIQDYWKLNSITVKNRYPLPLAMDIVNKLWDAKIFTKFDVCWGYHNIRIKEGDEWKAAFITNQGLFEPCVMFFGLTNSPATFQALMNAIFADLIAEGKVAVYLDDILIWSTTLEEHQKIVHKVLRRLEEHDLYLQLKKCEFEQSHVDYLGLVISPGKVSIDPVKVQAVRDWTPPTKLKEVRSFIGFANFYRRFIKDFSKICQLLHDLTKKDVPFIWGPAQQATFDTLKAAFTSTSVLAIWSPTRPTRIEVDASEFAIGRVILQKCDDLDSLWHPIAFRSASFKEAKCNYEIWNREMLAITKALEDWRQFLAGLDDPFEIWTDHRNLEFWRTTQHLTHCQAC